MTDRKPDALVDRLRKLAERFDDPLLDEALARIEADAERIAELEETNAMTMSLDDDELATKALSEPRPSPVKKSPRVPI